MIKQFTISFSRTINLGNFGSARVEVSTTNEVDDDFAVEKEEAQKELRRMWVETYKHQYLDNKKVPEA